MKTVNSILNNLAKYAKYFAAFLLFLASVYILEASYPRVFGVTDFDKIITILLGVFFFIISGKYGFLAIKKEKHFVIAIIIFGLLLRVLWNLYSNTQPKSDFKVINDSAHYLLGGKYDALHKKYYDLWTYNIPFVIYQFFILKIYNSIVLLKAVSVAMSVVSIFLTYRVGKSISGSEKTGRVAAFLCATFPPLIIYTSVLTNQTISIMLILLAYDTYFRTKSIYRTGLFFGLAQVFRPTSILFLVCFVVYYLFKEKGEVSFKLLKNKALGVIQLVFPYYLILFVVNIAITSTDLSRGSLFHDSAPNYKLLVGLNQETQGKYSKSDAALVGTLSEEDFEKQSSILIEERLKDKSSLIPLFDNKFKIMWGSNDRATSWAGFKFGNDFIMSYYYLIVLSCLVSILYYFKNGKKEIMLFVLTILAFMVVYLFIEIQTRYRYELYLPLILLSSIGLSKISEKVGKFL